MRSRGVFGRPPVQTGRSQLELLVSVILIVATLLVAALSAFVPPADGHHKSFANQAHGSSVMATTVLAVQVPATSHTQGQGSALEPRYAGGLASATGQSIPEAGQ